MIRFAPEAVSDIERVRHFLDIRNPDAAKRALRTIWSALERLQDIPELGRPTEDRDIRQIVIRFGAALPGTSRATRPCPVATFWCCASGMAARQEPKLP